MRRNTHWDGGPRPCSERSRWAVLLAAAVCVLTVVRPAGRRSRPPAPPPRRPAPRTAGRSAPDRRGAAAAQRPRRYRPRRRPGRPTARAPRRPPEHSLSCVGRSTAVPSPHDLRSACSYPAVGVFLRPGGTKSCTAAVVDSRHGDLLVTAAHCLPLDGAVLRARLPRRGRSATASGRSWRRCPTPGSPGPQGGRELAVRLGLRAGRPGRRAGASRRRSARSSMCPRTRSGCPPISARVTLIGYPHDRPGQHICTVDSAARLRRFPRRRGARASPPACPAARG